MREAAYWDMLGVIHYILLGIFVLIVGAEVYFFKRILAKKKRIPTILISFIFIGTLVISLIIRAFVFPGGSMHDTLYAADRAYINFVQEYLESYRQNCKEYPTTEQGFKALVEKPVNVDCPSYKSYMSKPFADLKYISDGKTYSIESTRQYRQARIFVRATNGVQPRYYVREAGQE